MPASAVAALAAAGGGRNNLEGELFALDESAVGAGTVRGAGGANGDEGPANAAEAEPAATVYKATKYGVKKMEETKEEAPDPPQQSKPVRNSQVLADGSFPPAEHAQDILKRFSVRFGDGPLGLVLGQPPSGGSIYVRSVDSAGRWERP